MSQFHFETVYNYLSKLNINQIGFKGQLISKWFFEVVDFLQKTNENNLHSSKNEFIRSFFGGNR